MEEMQHVALLLRLAAKRGAAGARQRRLDHPALAERVRDDLLRDLEHGDGADSLVGGEERVRHVDERAVLRAGGEA